MEYGRIPGIDKPVSRLVQGNTMIHTDDLDGAFALLDAVFEVGCTTFDTAHVYGGGSCERALGEWLAHRGLREQVVVVDKGAHHNADRRCVTPYDITAHLHDSLARLKTDYIDLYLLHRDDPTVPVEPIVDILNEHHQAGRIRAFGGSNWSHARLEAANAYASANRLVPFAVTSPHFSLAQQVEEPWENCVSITGPQQLSAQTWYIDNQMPVFAWSSLAGGFLSGRYDRAAIEALPRDCSEIYARCYRCKENLERLDRIHNLARAKGATIPQLALAFVLTHPMNVYPLVGCQSAEEFRINAAALDIHLSPEEMDWLDLKRETV